LRSASGIDTSGTIAKTFNTQKAVLCMRAEIQAIVDSIKQSVGLLRRHL
jgi:hypothetical protein